MNIEFTLSFTTDVETWESVRDILRLFADVTLKDMTFDEPDNIKDLEGNDIGSANIHLIESHETEPEKLLLVGHGRNDPIVQDDECFHPRDRLIDNPDGDGQVLFCPDCRSTTVVYPKLLT